MIHDFTNVKNIYIICGKTDMRKGIDGLATLIQDSFELDPYSDAIFLFSGGGKIVINVYILMEMASPCFINDWIMESSNGQEMKMKFGSSPNKNFDGCLKDSRFINLKPFKNLKKVSFKRVPSMV